MPVPHSPGAKGDGRADDADAIDKAVAAADDSGADVLFSRGRTYAVSRSVVKRKGMRIYSEEGGWGWARTSRTIRRSRHAGRQALVGLAGGSCIRLYKQTACLTAAPDEHALLAIRCLPQRLRTQP